MTELTLSDRMNLQEVCKPVTSVEITDDLQGNELEMEILPITQAAQNYTVYVNVLTF